MAKYTKNSKLVVLYLYFYILGREWEVRGCKDGRGERSCRQDFSSWLFKVKQKPYNILYSFLNYKIISKQRETVN